jgi:signal transduction histidine kinase
MAVDLGELRFTAVRDFCEQTFRPVAEQKRIDFGIELNGDLPPSMRTDSRRLQQVLKNLLSNAFKFTEKGGVLLTIRLATEGWSEDEEILNHAEKVVAFAVKDTGVGIAREKQHIIFEAFQQADGTTSRKYGGTGLGLSISREVDDDRESVQPGDHVQRLLYESLAPRGVLGLGQKQFLRFTREEQHDEALDGRERLFRKVA